MLRTYITSPLTLVQAEEYYGATRTRAIFERAIEALPDDKVALGCCGCWDVRAVCACVHVLQTDLIGGL